MNRANFSSALFYFGPISTSAVGQRYKRDNDMCCSCCYCCSRWYVYCAYNDGGTLSTLFVRSLLVFVSVLNNPVPREDH